MRAIQEEGRRQTQTDRGTLTDRTKHGDRQSKENKHAHTHAWRRIANTTTALGYKLNAVIR